MNIVVVPDKFKGSLTAEQVIEICSETLRELYPGVGIKAALLSDGGDGFLSSVAQYSKTNEVMVDTVDGLMRPIQAPFLYDSTQRTAYVELATTAGLVLLDPSERNPMHTSTYGVGLQIRHAIAMGAKSIYLGIGGSATNDGAIGIAQALGYRFMDESGETLAPIGANLEAIATIAGQSDLEGVSFFAINDVNNPLYGPDGAAFVYAPQKGADSEQVKLLDQGLRHLAETVKGDLQRDEAQTPGSGSAGGTGYGLKVFCGATYVSGIDFLLQLSGIASYLESHPVDLILTGEGKIDGQTLHGKLISGVIGLAKKHGIPTLGICGMADLTEAERQKLGWDELVVIADPNESVAYNMERAAPLLRTALKTHFKSKTWN